MFEVTAAAVSTSPKGEGGNQDRVAVFEATPAPGGAGVVVCDGVGALQESGAVAEEVTILASERLAADGVRLGIHGLSQALASARLTKREGATTLIAVAADGEGLVGHLMIGNGSLIEIEPFEPRPGATQLRWIDIALPQISWSEGRPALRSFLPTANGSLEAAKGYQYVAASRTRMYLACSDGIATDEDRAQGSDPDGRIWREVPPPLARVLERIGGGWDALLEAGEDGGGALTRLLEETLAGLATDPGLDDDASIGAVLLRPAPAAEARP